MTPGGVGLLTRSQRPQFGARRRRRLVVAVVVAIVVVAAAAAAAWRAGVFAIEPRFVVVDHQTGEVLYERSAEIGERFVLEHTHSVTKRPVVETFSVAEPDAIAIEELWFDEFGPNLPAGAEQLGDDVTFLHEDGGYRVLHHGRMIGNVPLRVGGPEVDHRLMFDDGERLRLLDAVPRGTWVDFEVRGG